MCVKTGDTILQPGHVGDDISVSFVIEPQGCQVRHNFCRILPRFFFCIMKLTVCILALSFQMWLNIVHGEYYVNNMITSVSANHFLWTSVTYHRFQRHSPDSFYLSCSVKHIKHYFIWFSLCRALVVIFVYTDFTIWFRVAWVVPGNYSIYRWQRYCPEENILIAYMYRVTAEMTELNYSTRFS